MNIDNLSHTQLEAEATIFRGCINREQLCCDENSDVENNENSDSLDDAKNTDVANAMRGSALTVVTTEDVRREKRLVVSLNLLLQLQWLEVERDDHRCYSQVTR